MTAWTELKPGHFDERLLPKVRKGAAGQGELFSVADVAPLPDGPVPAPELDGQGDLFRQD
jgi:hypothetical protein